MSLIVYKLIAALIIFLISLATVVYPLKRKAVLKQRESFELGEALASGIFLGAAFFHMLPDSIKLFKSVNTSIAYPVPEAICVLGFLFLLFLERLSLTKENLNSKASIPYILAIILIVHAITEGSALGLGNHFSDAFMIFIAIIAHKGSESFALCVTLLRHELSYKRVTLIVFFFALMTPIGILFGTILNAYTFVINGALTAALVNAFAAGTFLYISTLHHVHFHKHGEEDTQGLLEFASLVLGTLVMAVLAFWA